jgi:hypothetical protein
MEATVDIPQLETAMNAVAHQPRNVHGIAIVLPLKEGMREIAAEYLVEGPPFDPRELGLMRHQVYLSDTEAVFVFETEGALDTLDRMLADPDFWALAKAWEHIAAGEPRLATAAYVWPRHGRGAA